MLNCKITNINQAQSALKSGGSAIPTIIRTQALGEGVEPVGCTSKWRKWRLDFYLARENDAGAQRSLWIQSLKDSNWE